MNNKSKKVIVYLSVIGVILIVTGTFAYFRTEDTYNVKGTVINWSFKAENNTESFTKQLGDIAPGDSGSFTINLDPSSAPTDIECSITPNINGTLAGMKLYSDETHNEENEITSDKPLKVTLTSNASAQNITIYWVWEYDTGLLTEQNISFSVNVIGKQITTS